MDKQFTFETLPSFLKDTYNSDDLTTKISDTHTKIEIKQYGNNDCENLYKVFDSLDRLDSSNKTNVYRSFFRNKLKDRCSMTFSFDN
jgi:hypothetical protein